MNNIKRGDIFFADLNGALGSEQSGIRPVLIIQNDIGNKFSPTIIIAPITTHDKKIDLPTHVIINDNCGLNKRSIIMLEQIRTIDRVRLRYKIGMCEQDIIDKINSAIKISLNIR